MYLTCEGLAGAEVRDKVILVDGLAHATVILISDFEGGRVGLKE